MGLSAIDLSVQDVESCYNNGISWCQGGYLDKTWNYAMNTGIVTEACFPQSDKWPPCPHACTGSV